MRPEIRRPGEDVEQAEGRVRREIEAGARAPPLKAVLGFLGMSKSSTSMLGGRSRGARGAPPSSVNGRGRPSRRAGGPTATGASAPR